MKLKKVHIINGPNLGLLEKRNPSIYGGRSFHDYYQELLSIFPDYELEYFQSNHEGAIIDYLHEFGFDDATYFVLNAGAYSHYSYAIRDAIEMIDVPIAEVHISNIKEREDFRKVSVLSEVCNFVVIGIGLEGYQMTIEKITN